MNIYEKMSAITQEISAVAKNLNVGLGKNQYKAVGEADVLAAVKPAEAKYKVYSYPVSRELIDSGELTSVSTYNGQSTEKKQLFMRLKTTYRFVNLEKPEEYIDMISYGDGVDSQDKAPGKAMTYSDKYSLLKAYKIITGDDPDQSASEPLSGKTTSYKAAQATGGRVTQSAQDNASESVSDGDIEVLRGLCEKAGQDPAKLFKNYNWPFLTKAQYADGVKQLQRYLEKHGDKRAS